ncbi:hypothetical protein [Ekhidna sp.]|uniref:hypothetical protein n=1 Tax=Ekhidna sp. TaxID=2608089 RepID=UPI003296D639
MIRISNYLLIIGIILIGIGCNQQEDVEPELTPEQKFALFGERIFNQSSEYLNTDIETEIHNIGNEIFDSFESYEMNFEKGRIQETATYIIEIDGVVYIATLTDDCLYYSHVDCFFSAHCSGVGSICG